MNETIENLKKEFNSKYPNKIKNKLIIVINGEGKSGKDYLINKAKESAVRKKINDIYMIFNASSIDPIKKIAEISFGWNGEKDEKSRNLLHMLKKASVDYSEFPTKYILSKIDIFVSNLGSPILSMMKKNKILFVHIGEWEEICKLKYIVEDKIPITTLFVKKNHNCINEENKLEFEDPRFDGNHDELNYDYVFTNSFDEQSENNFYGFISSIYADKVLNNPKYIFLVYDKENILDNYDQYINIEGDLIYNSSFSLFLKNIETCNNTDISSDKYLDIFSNEDIIDIFKPDIEKYIIKVIQNYITGTINTSDLLISFNDLDKLNQIDYYIHDLNDNIHSHIIYLGKGYTESLEDELLNFKKNHKTT